MYRNVLLSFIIITVFLVLMPITAKSSDREDHQWNRRNDLLRGNYSFTINQKCEVNVEEVVNDLQLLSEPIILVEWIIDGETFFKGDGTGHSSFRALRFISGRQSAENMLSGWSEGTCNLVYEVNRETTFIGELICEGINSTGKAFATSKFQIEGSISRDKQTLILSDTNPLEENIEVENYGILKGTCGRSGSAVKIKIKR